MNEKPSVVYYLARFVARVILRLLWRLRIENAHLVPKEGPIIIAVNHRSNIDPPVMGVAVPRIAHFLAKEELYRIKFVAWLLVRMNAMPLNRSVDIGALKVAKKILDQGGALVLFPEGTRSRDLQFRKPKPGVGLLSVKTNARIVPAYIENSNEIKRFKRVRIVFGEPFMPDPTASYNDIAVDVMRRIGEVRDKAG